MFLLLAATAQAQFVAPNVGDHFNGFNSSSNGPTDTPTWDPMLPTYTPTPTMTYNPFATDTPTMTPGSPTDTITNTFTATQTGTIYTPTPTWSSTPNITRASLVILPTAYSNGRYNWTGFNWDIDFSYYIGSIISRDENPADNAPNLDSLEQINLVLLTNDFKIAWIDDNGEMPGFATGIMTSLLAQVGTSGNQVAGTGSSQTTQAFQVAGNAIGSFYGVFSKTVAKQTAVHFGYMYGLDQVANSVFTGNYAGLLPYFAPGLNPYIGLNPATMFYVGFNTYFWGRNWKMEIWKPYALTEGSTIPGNPILLNTQIDGLPLAFNLGYERWDQGYAVLGYVNFRIPLLPSDPSY